MTVSRLHSGVEGYNPLSTSPLLAWIYFFDNSHIGAHETLVVLARDMG